VKDIHNQGGTMLGSSRGGFNSKEMIEAIKKKGITPIFVINIGVN